MYPFCCALIPILPRCASIHPCEDRIWVDVPFVPDSLVLNVGALLSRWTGNTWKASVHRPSEKTVDLMWPEGAKKGLEHSWTLFGEISWKYICGVKFPIEITYLSALRKDRIWHFFDETVLGSIRGGFGLLLHECFQSMLHIIQQLLGRHPSLRTSLLVVHVLPWNLHIFEVCWLTARVMSAFPSLPRPYLQRPETQTGKKKMTKTADVRFTWALGHMYDRVDQLPLFP